jgi:hypothetical protein
VTTSKKIRIGLVCVVGAFVLTAWVDALKTREDRFYAVNVDCDEAGQIKNYTAGEEPQDCKIHLLIGQPRMVDGPPFVGPVKGAASRNPVPIPPV